MTELPPPLVPADVDLRDFQFMPLDVDRLRDSDLAAQESAEACWAAVLLWCASWHQVPAASLPDDDRTLSKLAGYGRVIEEWQRVKPGALRGWVLCSDGRLYHSVVAEKALESWLEKLAARISGGEGNSKRWGIVFDRAPLDAAMAEARQLLMTLNPGSRTLSRKRTSGVPNRSPPDQSGSPPDAQEQNGNKRGVEATESPPDHNSSRPDSNGSGTDQNRSPPDDISSRRDRKGQGPDLTLQGQGQGSLPEQEKNPSLPSRDREGVDAEGGTERRAKGTNPRALATNPRANGTNPRAARNRSLDAWRKSVVVIDRIRGNGNGLTWNDARVQIDDPTAHLATEQIGGYRIVADRDRFTESSIEERFREAYEQLAEAARGAA